MMTVDAQTSPDATGFSSETASGDPLMQLNSRLDTFERKLDDIIYGLEQVEEKLHDICVNLDLRND